MIRDFLRSSFRSRRSRAAILVSMAIVALSVIPLTATAAPDGVSLQVEKGPGQGFITLNWIGGVPIFDIYRAPSAMGVLAPEYLVSSTSDRTFVTEVGPEPIAFFTVKPPCVADPPERCDGSDNDCNGVIDDPGAESSCSIANASAICVVGECTIGNCDSGYSDLNTDPTDGCEFACQDSDVPDDGFLDTNCDGIDGDIADAVFVSPFGNDADPGMFDLPVQSIAVALSLASAAGKSQVYLDVGSYVETVELVNGISIYGGYSRDSGWARSVEFVPALFSNTVADGPERGVYGVGITLPTTLDRIWVRTWNAGPGQNNYAFHCVSCAAMRIKNCTLQAGKGGDGADGAPGVPGSAGTNGQQGGTGGDFRGGTAGAPGTSACLRSGGIGGAGGGTGAGQPGAAGTGATPGGPGGAGGWCTTHPTQNYPPGPGWDGSNGSHGSSGANGAGGFGGNGSGVVEGHWVGNSGSAGTSGTPGNGGGGGGGGGAMAICPYSMFGGSGGGGGGGGGCPASPGGGGHPGGGSFGAFFVDSDGFSIVDSTIISGHGGHGGGGGAGALGGASGIGGPRRGTAGSPGSGGAGGNGGLGGNSGYGGGGAGGVSFALYQWASSGTITGCTLSSGDGGPGGSGFNAGGAGASGAIYP